jgi:Secretion system C-terminal sorting domain
MKKLTTKLCIGALLMIAGQINAQAPRFYMPQMYGDASGNEMVKSIVSDNNSDLFVVGSYTSTSMQLGPCTLINNGGSDVFVAKYSSEGTFVWGESAGGAGADTANSVTIDASGNVYVVGTFQSDTINFGTYTLHNVSPGTSDIFIVKYTPYGDVIWAKCFGGPGNDLVNDIAVDANFNMFIAGNYFSPNFTIGTTPLTNADGSGSSEDIFYAKFDTAGTNIWAYSVGTIMDDKAQAITVDASGNVYMTGSYDSPSLTFGATATLGNNGDYDVYIVKFDGSGTPLWADAAPASSSNFSTDIGTDIVTDINGDVYMTGAFKSPVITFGTITLSNNTMYFNDAFIVKYNSAGVVQWAKRMGGNGDEVASSVNVDNCGYIYVCGSLGSATVYFAGMPLGFSVGNEIMVLKYDDSGNEVWGKTAIGNNDDFGTAVSGDVDGNIIIAGATNSAPAMFNAIDINNSAGGGGTYDFFLTQVQTTATDIYAYITNLGTPLTNGKVYLYGRLNDYAKLNPLDSVSLTSTGIAHFSNVLNLNYLIKVNADTLLFPLAITTYNGDEYLWDQVTTWPHSCNSNDTIYIFMIQQAISGLGNGKISGYVTKTAYYTGMPIAGGGWSRAQGDPVQGIDVKIRHNPGGASVAATVTDVNGYYEFANVDTGSCTILVDIPGLGRDSSYSLLVTPTDTLFLQNNYVADSDYIFISNLPVGIIKPAEHSSRISVAPNPFSNATVITFGEKQTRTVLRITDALGTEIKSIVVSNENRYVLEKGDMKKGIYFIQITDENKNVTNRKIVIQ